jgi:hypothetical protein
LGPRPQNCRWSSLLAALDLGVNQDIKSRVTYSAITKRLPADDLRDFLLRELDRVGLPHNTFTRPAVDLIVRSADGILRQARQRQPRPHATPLAKGGRPRRLLTGVRHRTSSQTHSPLSYQSPGRRP